MVLFIAAAAAAVNLVCGEIRDEVELAWAVCNSKLAEVCLLLKFLAATFLFNWSCCEDEDLLLGVCCSRPIVALLL